MTLLLCLSNMFVPIVLTQVLSNPTTMFIVFVDQPNISKVFSNLNLNNIVVIDFRGGFSLRDNSQRKKELLERLKQYQIDIIYFYHTEYGEVGNWLILQFYKTAKIFFASPYKSFPLKTSWSLKAFYYKLRTFFLYSYNPKMLILGNRIIPSIPRSFFEKVHVNVTHISVNNEQVSFATSKLLQGIKRTANIVLLTGGVKESGLDPKGYKEIQNIIIEKLGMERIVLKCHPRFSDLYGVEKKISAIDSYIPMNLLLSNYKVFIGYSTTVLVEAAQNGALAISTLEFMPSLTMNNIENRKKVLNMKLDGKGVIFYPKSVEELVEIVKCSEKVN